MLESLVFIEHGSHEKLVFMSIHERIKRRRNELGWSHERLAKEIQRLEGTVKPLAWQAVQQWEAEGGTAPTM